MTVERWLLVVAIWLLAGAVLSIISGSLFPVDDR
jgi:hypothetical protein